MTVTRGRWQTAQQYEHDWWDQRADMDLEYLEVFAQELQKDLSGLLELTGESEIVEIGSGPGGLITYLPGKRRCGVEPLEEFFATVPRFAAARDQKVEYYARRGEELPFADRSFDLAICDNVLDHTEDPVAVVREIRRVLRIGGVLYFRQNTFTRWGVFVRKLLESITFDRGHPHTFTKSYLEMLLSIMDFEPVKQNERGYGAAWRDDITSGSWKGVMRALLVIPRDTVLWVLRRVEPLQPPNPA